MMKKKLNERVTLIEVIILRKLQLDYLKYDEEKIMDLRFDLTLKSNDDLYFLLELYQTEFVKKSRLKKTNMKFDFNPN